MSESENGDRTTLRQNAEFVLKSQAEQAGSGPVNEADLLKLIHELQVHQIELELQNEELIRSKQQEELAREKFTSLFDFAPSAYFTLGASGKILELNLAGAKMLGRERQSLIDKKLAGFLTGDSRAAYKEFLSKTLSGESPQTCEVAFDTPGHQIRWALLSSTLADDEIPCLITAADITEKKAYSDEIRWRNDDLQLANSINQAANRNEDLGSIIKIIADQLRKTFDSHLLSIHLPDERSGEFVMHGNSIDTNLIKKIEKLLGRSVPQIRLKMDQAHPFSEMEHTRKGILCRGEKEVSDRLKGYVAGTGWSSAVKDMIKRMIPALCNLLNYQSSVAVPMISNDKIVGFLELGSRNLMTHHDLDRIQSIADHFAAVIVRYEFESKLRESEVQYRNLANAGSALIWTSDADKLCNYFNSIWLKFTGRTLEQELGNGWTDGVHPDDFSRCIETYTRAFDLRLPFQMEYRLRHAGGEYKWLMDMGTPNYNGSGEFVGYIGHCFDISDRKNAELALHQSEEKYRSIFESVQEVYFEASMDGILLEVSPSIEIISRGQFKRNEMIGQSFIGFYKNPVERDIYFSKLLAQKRVNDYELSLRNKDGSAIPVAVSSVLFYDSSGRPEKITGILRDISERKIAENALKETLEQLNKANLHLEKRVEERTREILEISGLQKGILVNAPLAILTTEEDGAFTSINPAGVKMLGYSADELVGKLTPFHFHDRDELVRHCIVQTAILNPTDEEVNCAALKSIMHKTTEWIWIRKNGEKFPVRITHSSIIDDNGQFRGYIVIIIDITQERMANESLRKSEDENRAILQAVPDLMFRIHRDGTYLDSHSENDSLLYAPKALFVGKKVSDVLPADLALQSMEAISKAFVTGEVEQYEYSLDVQGRNQYYENRIIAISDSEVLSIIREITDRKESETALKMQSAAFESFSLTIIITDVKGRIQWVNSAFTHLTGYSIEEAIGKTPGELVGSGKQDKSFYSEFWGTILNKGVWSGELINRRKDGSLYYEEETITPVLDSQGNISSFIAIKIDISERKRLYQELADEKRRLADIIHGTNVGTWEWNIQTGETIFNEQWAEMLGYTLDEISPVSIETWMKFAHPDDLAASDELLERHFSGSLSYYSFESRMRHRSGEWIWVLDRGRVHERDSDGKPLLMSGTHQDITERKRAEEELVWNKSFLELMSNSSPLGFLVVDNRNDEILYLNKRFCQIWEIERIEDQLHRGEFKNNDIIPYCLPVLADIPAFAESCKPLQDEANRVTLEDEIAFTENRFIRRFSTQIRGGNDEYFGRFYIFEDITERKRVEEDIRTARNEAEKANLAKSEFLSRMSHELRTPMNSILGFAQLLEMGDLNSKQQKGVTHILSNGKHLLALINEVLDISGIEAGRQILVPEPVQLASILNEITDVFHIAARKVDVSIKLVDSADNNLFVLADKLRLKQVLINLLSNAIKYNRTGGSVVIRATLQPAGDQNIPQIRISVSDTGHGIGPDDIGKLFQAFERIGAAKTETEGTGLGLMVVKKLTESMGGMAGVVSEVGTGSTFWIELPLAGSVNPEAGQVIDSRSVNGPRPGPGATILYIEDNLANIELVEHILEEHRHDFELVTTRYGKLAVGLAKEHKPGLILLDLDLPDIQGKEVLDQLLADAVTRTIPVIIVSADAMRFQIERLMEAGAIDYLTKPLDVMRFLEIIDRHIQS